MILFVGCSFTWGSGLQYEYLYENGWSVDRLNDDVNRVIAKNDVNPLDYKADEYRKQHSWPNLVAKELNKSYRVGTIKSASNLGQILKSIIHEKRLCYSSKSNQIDTIVVQFTDWTRDNLSIQSSIDKTIEYHVKQIADACDEIRNDKFINNHSYKTSYPSWVGLSWREDIGNVLKEKYVKNFIPILHNDNEYISFDKIQEGNMLILDDVISGLSDGHFNSKGCEVISNSIVKKLREYE